MHTALLDYTDGALTCEAFIACDDTADAARPCALVAHSWAGQSDAERDTATRLARLGYVGFAPDVYGKGTRGGVWDADGNTMHAFTAPGANMPDKGHPLQRRRRTARVDGDR